MIFGRIIIEAMRAEAGFYAVRQISPDIHLTQRRLHILKTANPTLKRCVNDFNAELRSIQSQFGDVALDMFLRGKPLNKQHQPMQEWDGVRIQVLSNGLGLRISGLLDERPFRLATWASRDRKVHHIFAGFCDGKYFRRLSYSGPSPNRI